MRGRSHGLVGDRGGPLERAGREQRRRQRGSSSARSASGVARARSRVRGARSRRGDRRSGVRPRPPPRARCGRGLRARRRRRRRSRPGTYADSSWKPISASLSGGDALEPASRSACRSCSRARPALEQRVVGRLADQRVAGTERGRRRRAARAAERVAGRSISAAAAPPRVRGPTRGELGSLDRAVAEHRPLARLERVEPGREQALQRRWQSPSCGPLVDVRGELLEEQRVAGGGLGDAPRVSSAPPSWSSSARSRCRERPQVEVNVPVAPRAGRSSAGRVRHTRSPGPDPGVATSAPGGRAARARPTGRRRSRRHRRLAGERPRNRRRPTAPPHRPPGPRPASAATRSTISAGTPSAPGSAPRRPAGAPLEHDIPQWPERRARAVRRTAAGEDAGTAGSAAGSSAASRDLPMPGSPATVTTTHACSRRAARGPGHHVELVAPPHQRPVELPPMAGASSEPFDTHRSVASRSPSAACSTSRLVDAAACSPAGRGRAPPPRSPARRTLGAAGPPDATTTPC